MNFAELLAAVYILTVRPDLVGETTLAIQQATLQLHRQDFYSKDIYESGISFPTLDFYQTINYRQLVPNWRALKYLRKWQTAQSVSEWPIWDFPLTPLPAPGNEIKIIEIEKVLDAYKLERYDVAYLAGEVIQIKSATKEQYYLLGCYVNPIVTPDVNYNSWIALDHPYAIVYKAASIVAGIIGNDSLQKYFDIQSQIEAAEITINNLNLVGS